MGMNKGRLDYKGTPLWRFQIDKLIRLGPNQLFFSVTPEMTFPEGPWTLVYDRSPRLGPLGGLEAALRLTSEAFLVTLAVDMPEMTTEFLRFLLGKAETTGVVPRVDGFYHGASAVYPARILPIVEQVLVSDDRSFQHLVTEALKARLLQVEEIKSTTKKLFENWNSPQDVKGDCFRREGQA